MINMTMEVILQLITFIISSMTGLINSFDNVYLGSYSILDLFLSIIYLKITFWGIFSLINPKNKDEVPIND